MSSVFLRPLVVAVALLPAGAFAAERPNVVLIISDDQAWTDFGFMGHDVIETPNLDKLASQSAVLPNGYVVTPLCRASLSSIITGQYPHQTKICCNDPPKGLDRNVMLKFLRDAPTIPRILAKHGYRSLQTGKFWEGPYKNGGFTHGMTENKIGGRHGDTGLKIGRKTMQPIYDFIDESGDTPFFIWYAPMLPHNPHNPPRRILKKYAVEGRNRQVARYWAMCEWFDETCGQLLDYIDKKGLRDNTLVVFVVDNGWIQKPNPDRDGDSQPIRSKLTPYDAGLRTPIMFRWPGKIEPKRHQELVSSLDLAPSILAACGAEPTEEMSGVNLIDVVRGRSTLERRALFGEVFIHTSRSLEEPAASLSHRWARENDWKLILPQPGVGKPELYNVVRDPAEKTNLTADHPDKVQHLTRLLDSWWTGRPGEQP